MCRAAASPASSSAQQAAALQPCSQDRITQVCVAPLAPPESPARGSKQDTQQQPLSAAKEQQQGTARPKQEGGSQRGRGIATESGKQEQSGWPQPGLSCENAAQAPQAHDRQHAVVYQLGSPQAAHAASASSILTAGHLAKAAMYHLGDSHQSSRPSAGSPAPSGCMEGVPPSQTGARAGLSIAQQAVLRCRHRQLELEQGERKQGLQQPRPPQDDIPPADSSSRQAGASPLQHVSLLKAPRADADSPGGPASRQRGPSLQGPHDSASSAQVEQALPRAQNTRRDSDRRQRPSLAGAGSGGEALGTPQHAGSNVAARQERHGDASAGHHAECHKQGDVIRHALHRPAHVGDLAVPLQAKAAPSPVAQVTS